MSILATPKDLEQLMSNQQCVDGVPKEHLEALFRQKLEQPDQAQVIEEDRRAQRHWSSWSERSASR